MKVMVLGIRGIPNVEGGIETHAEHLYPRLAAMGCEVEVLVRTPFVPRGTRRFGRVRLRRIWSPKIRGFEAAIHSILGVLYASFARPDVLHVHAVGPALVTPIARLLGLRVVVTHHGPDYDRDKWGPVVRRLLRLGERFGMRCSHARISISPVICELIRKTHNRDSELIPNGVVIPEPEPDFDHVRRFGLQPGRYFLQVGRMVPEKRHLDLITAYRATLPNEWKLAIVCRVPDDAYARSVVEAARTANVVLTGFLNGTALHQIYSHAGAFVLPSSHEGLPIAMLEAMSYGLPVLASDIPSNIAIGLEADCYFPLGDLASLTDGLQRLRWQLTSEWARAERRRFVATRYDWDRIAERTIAVYSRVAKSEA